MNLLAAILIKSFTGKARLAPVLNNDERQELTRLLADRSARAAQEAGAAVAIVTADDQVAAWAAEARWETVAEPRGGTGGLNSAAARACSLAEARGRRWAVIHADLALVTASDLVEVFTAAEVTPALAPAHDGGTNVIAGQGTGFPFSYGRGSFFRHLSAVGERAAIVVRPGLALDVDTPRDLEVAKALGGLQ